MMNNMVTDKDTIKAYWKEYYKKNRAKMLVSHKKYIEKNKDTIKQKNKLRYATHIRPQQISKTNFLLSLSPDELLNNGILIDYGPFTNTGGTTTVSWTIGVTAGYKGAMVTASYSEAYAIQQIQIYVESDLSQNLAQWRHLSDPVSSYTQTYKPGIVFRVPQNTPLSSIKLSVNSAVEFFYWMGVLPVLIDWNITIGANLPPARPEPPSGPSLGDVGSTYEFSVLSADPEWSEITYEINWGDGHTSTKSAESDVVTVMSHAWDSKGTYSIQVRAKDERGEWSDWSQIHSIRINDNCCFPVGTRITMADGSHKNIENVKCGEKILSYNVFNGKFSSWTVFGVSHPIHPVYEINNGLLSLTKSHPLYVKKVNGKTGWGAIVPKREVVRFRGDGLTLEIGDQLLTSNKEWIKVTNITCNSVPIQTYNILSFWGKQNFFANDILVFEEHGSIPLLTKLYFLKFLDRYPNVFPILRHLLGY